MSEHLFEFSGKSPGLGKDVFLAPGARLLGDVIVGDRVSIWCNAVLRADINRIRIGDGSNIQDNCTLHVDDEDPVLVGRDVVVGHAAILHGCTVEDECLIGMGSVLLNGVRIGKRAVVAAGAVLPPGLQVPPGYLVMGVGGKISKPLPPDFWDREPLAASKYRRLAESYMKGSLWRWPDAAWDARDAREVERRL